MSILDIFKPNTKLVLRNIGRNFGVDIRVNGLRSREDLRLVHYLSMHGIDRILDIGGNIGQFGEMMLDAGYKGKMLSFEPLPDAHAALTKVATARGAGRWAVAERMALTDHEGEALFHVTEATAASSLLRPLGSMVETLPATAIERDIMVPVRRLDDVAEASHFSSSSTFMKLDVQGAEQEVLAGAPETLRGIKGILIETTLTPLYEGQVLFEKIHELIGGLGFELWDVWPGFRSPDNLRLNQMDLVYFRPAPGSAESTQG